MTYDDLMWLTAGMILGGALMAIAHSISGEIAAMRHDRQKRKR